MTPAALKEFALAMVESKVLRFRGDVGPPEQEGEEEAEIELHPSAFDAPVPADTMPTLPPDLDDAEKCACGCLREAEHNAQGLCIGKGCPVSLCNPEVKRETDPV